MAQEDKLKREIDLIGKLLTKLLSDLTGSKTASDTEEVIQSIQQFFIEQLNLDLNTLTNSTPDELAKILEDRNLNDLHLQQLADLFYQMAEQSSSRENKHKLYIKALFLYESGKNDSFSLDRHYKIEKLKKLL